MLRSRPVLPVLAAGTFGGQSQDGGSSGVSKFQLEKLRNAAAAGRRHVEVSIYWTMSFMDPTTSLCPKPAVGTADGRQLCFCDLQTLAVYNDKHIGTRRDMRTTLHADKDALQRDGTGQAVRAAMAKAEC